MNKRHLISNNNNKLHQRNYKSTPSLRRSITTKRPSTTSSTIKPFKSNRKISSRKTRDDSIITNNKNNNHVYSISPTHKTKSRLYKEEDGKTKSDNNSMNHQDDDYDNTSSLQQLLKFQNTKRINKNNDETLTFKRRDHYYHYKIITMNLQH